MPNKVETTRSFFAGFSTPATVSAFVVATFAIYCMMINLFHVDGLAAGVWTGVTALLLVEANIEELSTRDISIGFAAALVVGGVISIFC